MSATWHSIKGAIHIGPKPTGADFHIKELADGQFQIQPKGFVAKASKNKSFVIGQKHICQRHRSLVKDGTFKPSGDRLRVTRPVDCTSLSFAVALGLGSSTGGVADEIKRGKKAKA